MQWPATLILWKNSWVYRPHQKFPLREASEFRLAQKERVRATSLLFAPPVPFSGSILRTGLAAKKTQSLEKHKNNIASVSV
jgi:hypothetical protein